jgi:hypothetical protein
VVKKMPLMGCSGAEELRANGIAVGRIGSAQDLRSSLNIVSRYRVDQCIVMAHHGLMEASRLVTTIPLGFHKICSYR